MNAPETALPGKDTAAVGPLYMAFELRERARRIMVEPG